MRKNGTARAFTLIELLVVVAIIALLLSILLPSLQCAREQARAASCGVILRGFGTGLATYETENNGWFPGTNTSGVATALAAGDADALRNNANIPVQGYDWMTPILRYDTQLSGTRAERFKFLWSTYQCPSQKGENNDLVFAGGLAASPDAADFAQIDTYPAISYLMPGHFQLWGLALQHEAVASGTSPSGRPMQIRANTVRSNWDLYHPGQYRSRVELVGPPSRKIAVCDATRFLDSSRDLDFNPAPDPRPGGTGTDPFGAFCCNSAWWAGSQAFGVRPGSENWNGRPVSGPGPAAEGEGMRLSYRHGCNVKNTLPQTVRDNKGSINALFFDGHVARLDDKASRNPELWYPSGAKVFSTSNGLIDLFAPGERLP